ncbi:SCO3374 family protein [Streptomyces sp. NPDC018610]|uniref:SCO3374 family protein n=1 Tax=Streptomyces sp. NPDC018610 TaxID=3365049 RepID=UPI0037996C2E
MVGSPSAVPLPVPLPRRPPVPDDGVRRWYEEELGWETAPGAPVRLVVGHRFDVLDLPLEAGLAALRHLGPASPVAVRADRMRVLVAAGSAEELPGLLEWLEWGALDLDLVGLGAGAVTDAPAPPEGVIVRTGAKGLRTGGVGSQGAAVWLRPPVPGREVEPSLPTLSALGGRGEAPDLVRLVSTAATQCHRLRLRRACARPSVLS